MNLEGIKIAFALTGSYSLFNSTISKMKDIIKEGGTIVPIMSFNASNIDTRYGKAQNFIDEIEKLTEHKIINTFVEAEQIVKKNSVDIMVIAPCTGNTIAKLANGIMDTPVLLAAKSSLRYGNSLVIGISTNDGLSSNATNVGKLLNSKNIYLIPFGQDNPITKPNSIVFDSTYLIKAITYALENKQVQPILI